MTKTPAVPDRLLTEIERQELYLSELPEDYQFPLFSGRQAVESQRRSGYKDTARAAREIIDNALEAGAKNIWITFERPRERQKGEREDKVAAIGFIDDGPGMLSPGMLRYALSWGGGTHFKSPERIGKFGFGLPNSSINQTRRVEVYSKVKQGNWHVGTLDINEVPTHGLVTIPEPQPSELPEFVLDYLTRNKISLESGTVVVWVKPDRLTYRVAATLRQHFIEDFGVVYRGLLNDFSIVVENTRVHKVDPLFLMPDSRLYKSPDNGGAVLTHEAALVVKFYSNEETGAQHLGWLETEADLEEARRDPTVSVGVISIRIGRFPFGFVLGEPKHKGTDEYKRFEIRKPRRGMSFVRGGREIDTVDAFPKSSKDESNGLGNWPLLQGHAYHWGIEVSFGPELDEVFGIGNDKQTVRPIEDFWKVLATAEIDALLMREQNWQTDIRAKEKQRRVKEKAENPTEPTPATEAAAEAGKVIGGAGLPDSRKVEARQRFEDAAKQHASGSGKTIEEARKAIQAEAERKQYAIDFFESEGGVFFKPGYGNGNQRVALINSAHPFFTNFYVELLRTDDPRASYAVDLLLLALADSELRAEGPTKDIYEHERENRWSPFLKAGLKALERLAPRAPEEEEIAS